MIENPGRERVGKQAWGFWPQNRGLAIALCYVFLRSEGMMEGVLTEVSETGPLT